MNLLVSKLSFRGLDGALGLDHGNRLFHRVALKKLFLRIVEEQTIPPHIPEFAVEDSRIEVQELRSHRCEQSIVLTPSENETVLIKGCVFNLKSADVCAISNTGSLMNVTIQDTHFEVSGCAIDLKLKNLFISRCQFTNCGSKTTPHGIGVSRSHKFQWNASLVEFYETPHVLFLETRKYSSNSNNFTRLNGCLSIWNIVNLMSSCDLYFNSEKIGFDIKGGPSIDIPVKFHASTIRNVTLKQFFETPLFLDISFTEVSFINITWKVFPFFLPEILHFFDCTFDVSPPFESEFLTRCTIIKPMKKKKKTGMYAVDKCLNPNTHKTYEGTCECDYGYSNGDPYAPEGCYRCNRECHDNSICVYPGKCACMHGYVENSVKKCVLPAPHLLSAEPNPVYADGYETVRFSYYTSPNFTALGGFCKFGSVSVIAKISEEGRMVCTVPKLKAVAVRAFISFDNVSWSSEELIIRIFPSPQGLRIYYLVVVILLITLFTVRYKNYKRKSRVDEENLLTPHIFQYN